MFRGSVFQFRLNMYLRLLRKSFNRTVVALMAGVLIVAMVGSISYTESSSLALAANDQAPTNIVVDPEDVRPVESLVNTTKPVPRSRQTKSQVRVFNLNNRDSQALTVQNIELSLPILMYHKTPADFEVQIQELQAKGYTAVTMRQASRILRSIEAPPAKPIVITFDDGFSDQLSAFEILKRFGMPATFYIMPGGELSQWCVGAERHNQNCGDSYLNWDEIKMLSDSGLVEIGSHTIDHAQLNTLDSNIKREQITNSKAMIEQKIGKEVVSFAYPYGAFDGETIELARVAGYTSAVSTIGGVNQSTNILFELRRVRNTYDLP